MLVGHAWMLEQFFFSFTSCSALESSSKMWAIGLLQSQVDTFQSKYLVVSIYVHSDTG